MDKKINLKIDGKNIPMNAFVKKIFLNIIWGMLSSLDKLPEKKSRIEILIDDGERN